MQTLIFIVLSIFIFHADAARRIGKAAAKEAAKLGSWRGGAGSGSIFAERHLRDTPFKPGVVRGLQQAQGSGGTGPVQPSNETIPISLPWEDGVEPVVRCPGTSQTSAAAGQSEAERNLNEALDIFCSTGIPYMKQLVEFYVVPEYRKNYERLRGEDGWIEKAYLTYMGLNAQSDIIGAEEDLLVQSIHHFSKMPVVVTNFKATLPKSFSPERFPNLVVMQGRYSTHEAGKSFNFNKITAMLFTKVKAGLVLDADQFVNRGLDAMLDRAAEETTAEYPYPIMPVHWMTRDPEASDMSRFPSSYAWQFKGNNEGLPNRTMRWGHAHPTWAHQALPWLAKWSSYVLIPRVAKSPFWLQRQGWLEDEDLLNIALWATEGATKQWCKYDLPKNEAFKWYLQQDKNYALYPDSKYYPKGIGFIFFTSHDGKEPDKSYAWLELLWDDSDDRRKAILYDGRWFGSGKALKAHDPTLNCIA